MLYTLEQLARGEICSGDVFHPTNHPQVALVA